MLLALLLVGCDDSSEACSASKATARTAWGEVGVRYALELSAAESALKERSGRLAALSRRPDAPAQGKAALTAEIATMQAVVDALRPKVAAAQAVSAALAGGTVAEARALSAAAAATLDGEDVRAAVARTDSVAVACGSK